VRTPSSVGRRAALAAALVALAACESNTPPTPPTCQSGYHASGASCVRDVLDLSSAMSRVETIQVDQIARGTKQPDILKLRGPATDEVRKRLYLSGTLSPQIAVIDATTDTIIDAIDVGTPGYVSKYLVVNPTTGILYFTTLEAQQLYRVDPTTKKVSAPISVTGGGALAVDAVHDRVYATAKDEIRIYDGALTLLAKVTATGVSDLKVDAAGSRLFAVQPPATVNVYDLSNPASVTVQKSYTLPSTNPKLQARFVIEGGGRIYVGCDPGAEVIIDEASGAMQPVQLGVNVGSAVLLGDALYVLTGYPFKAGYLPDADAAYGVIYVLDAVTGAQRATIQGGMQGEGFAIYGSGAAAKLYLANTGEATLAVYDLASRTLTKKIDSGTSIEDIVVRPSDGSLVLRNRLGGSSLLLLKDHAVTSAPQPGNWPTRTLFDETKGVVYTLSHYQSQVTAFEADTLAVRDPISLGVARLRSDALSTMALDSVGQKLYAALPELGQVVAVDLKTGRAGAPVTIEGFDASKVDSPAALQVATNGKLGRVYVLSVPQKKLSVFDSSLGLLRSLDLAASYPSPIGGNPIDVVVSDDDAARVYVGSLVLDAEGTSITGHLPEGDKVVGIYRAGERLYAAAYVSPSSPAARDGHERLVELERKGLTVTRRFDLTPVNFVKSAYAFDFARGLAYAGYFETGSVDVIRIGLP